mmetsp:Transcript_11395/g.22811  ORF Transcript_11395/g.22811 Transcript_11395/m.22811 type:complete len:347 (-) Transcript_11395:75-1115(-)
MAITHRHITTANEAGGSPLLPISTQTNATTSFYDANKKNLGRKHTAKQLSDKSVAVVAALAFLGLLTPMLLFGNYHRGNSSSSNLRSALGALGDGPVPRPKNWKTWGYHGFRDNFRCHGYLSDRTKPLPTMEDWETMLKAYNQVVDPTYKFDPDIPPTQGYRLNEDGAQPYYAKLSPGKGRGLFASRDIQKGEIVHDGNKSDVVFPDGLSWKRYMFALPRTMACDQAEWTFTQKFKEGGPMRVVSSLNIAILMNEGNTILDVNVQPEDENGNPSEYSAVFYAMRDIKKDEEILMDYADYDTDFNAAGIGHQVEQSKMEVVKTYVHHAAMGWGMIFRQVGSTLGLGS